MSRAVRLRLGQADKLSERFAPKKSVMRRATWQRPQPDPGMRGGKVSRIPSGVVARPALGVQCGLDVQCERLKPGRQPIAPMPIARSGFSARPASRAALDKIQRLQPSDKAIKLQGRSDQRLAGAGSVCTLQLDAAREAWACGIRPGSGASAFITISPAVVGESMINRSAAVTSSSSGNSAC